MKFIKFLLFILLISACSSGVKLASSSSMSLKVDIQAGNDLHSVNLNALAVFGNDTSYVNVFGPFGINLSRVLAVGDSLFVVDLYNKTLYLINAPNSGTYIRSLFMGKLSDSGKLFFYRVFSFFTNGKRVSRGSTIPLDFNSSSSFRKRLVNIKYENTGTPYYANLVVRKARSSGKIKFDIATYRRYNTVYLELK